MVLGVSGLLKLRDRAHLPGALRAFGVPAAAAGWAGGLLVAAELALAGLVPSGIAHPWPAWGAVALLGAFTVAVTVNLAAGRRPPCPCFGVETATPVSGMTVARNGLLLALAVVATG